MAGMVNNPARATSVQRIEAEMKGAEAVRLRSEGKTFDQIAAELGYSNKSSAYAAFQRGLKELKLISAEDFIKKEIEHMEYLRERLSKAIQAGDIKAIETSAKLSDKIYKWRIASSNETKHANAAAMSAQAKAVMAKEFVSLTMETIHELGLTPEQEARFPALLAEKLKDKGMLSGGND